MAGVSGGIETWNAENAWARSIGYDMKNRYARLGKYPSRIATMNLLLEKERYRRGGGFDENLPSQYDTDLGFRITRRATRLYEPSAKCYHFNRTNVTFLLQAAAAVRQEHNQTLLQTFKPRKR